MGGRAETLGLEEPTPSMVGKRKARETGRNHLRQDLREAKKGSKRP